MLAFSLAVLLAVGLACPGDSERHAKLFFCPSYREIRQEDSVVGAGELIRRNDPLWLLEKEDEWIPFRSLTDGHEPKTFRCIFYYLAAFSHLMLDFFTPSVPVYYVYPYYRFPLSPGEITPESPAAPSGPPSSLN